MIAYFYNHVEVGFDVQGFQFGVELLRQDGHCTLDRNKGTRCRAIQNAVEIVPNDLHHVVFRCAELGVEVKPDFFFVFHVILFLGVIHSGCEYAGQFSRYVLETIIAACLFKPYTLA